MKKERNWTCKTFNKLSFVLFMLKLLAYSTLHLVISLMNTCASVTCTE